MSLQERLKNFARDTDGAVTVDWVVLTAAIAFVSVAVIGSVSQAALDQSNGIGAYVTTQQQLLSGN